MKVITIVTIAAAGVLLWTLSPSHKASQAMAAPDKVVYELWKQCGISASQLFAQSHHGNTSAERVANGDDSDTSWFENHCNSSLNACFMIQHDDHFYGSAAAGKFQNYTLRMWTLIDVNENREIDNGSRFVNPMSGEPCEPLTAILRDPRLSGQGGVP